MDKGKDGDEGQGPEHLADGVLSCRPASCRQGGPLLSGELLRPARQGVAFGVRNPQLREAVDHLEDEAVEGALHV